MHPQEVVAKFFLQVFQCIGQQQFVPGTMSRDIFLPGDEAAYLGHGHGFQAAMPLAADVGPGSARRPRFRNPGCRPPEVGQLHTIDPPGVTQGPFEVGRAHRLQQVGHGLVLQRFQRVLVIGRAEDDGRGLVHVVNGGSYRQPVHARHANIQQHEVRGIPGHLRQRLLTVRRLSALGLRHQPPEQPHQAVPRQRLVVDDQDSHTDALTANTSCQITHWATASTG